MTVRCLATWWRIELATDASRPAATRAAAIAHAVARAAGQRRTRADAGRMLAAHASSPAEVVLFGSRARGSARLDSDLDFLVIEDTVNSKLAEMVRLRDALPPLGVPVDVVVVARQRPPSERSGRAHSCSAPFRRAVSSSSADRQEAARLPRKGRQDEAVVAKFVDDPQIADAVIGFYAQQAVEKALKAILAGHGHSFPWTHDLRHLLECLDAGAIAIPKRAWEARRLSPWAVEFRYGETIDDPLDRAEALRLVREVLSWAGRETAAAPSDSETL